MLEVLFWKSPSFSLMICNKKWNQNQHRWKKRLCSNGKKRNEEERIQEDSIDDFEFYKLVYGY
jgi:hypothetical protein